jgi:hypothetical protein
MHAHASTRQLGQLLLILLALGCMFVVPVAANKRRVPAGGQRAVVVDERLAALREEPSLSAPLVQRLGRGRLVAVVGAARAGDGVNFYRVAVTRRTRGWLQVESVVAPARAHEDERLLRLIQGSEDFDRITRARIFLDEFPRSPLRPIVLLLFGVEAEEAAARLSRDAGRRLKETELRAGGAPLRSYFLNFNELDRYRRQGVAFTFDETTRQFHYDGASWRELLRRYPRSPEAAEARKRLNAPL